MRLPEIVEFIKTSILPVKLVTPDQVIDQCIQSAFRYFNNHSAVKIVQMVPATSPSKVSKYIKSVAQVYPDVRSSTLNMQDFPLYTLLGIQVIDGLTSDLILLSETYKTYMTYMAKDFDWTFLPVDDANDTNGGGSLFVQNVPNGCSRLCVIGSQRVFPDDDITNQYILDWLINYSRALVMVTEGGTLRKGDIIGVKNDGSDIISDAKEEIKSLRDDLKANGRWLGFLRRF